MELSISISQELIMPSGKIFLILIAFICQQKHVSAASYSGMNESDRLDLLQFKHHISDDPHGVLNSWNDSLHHCQWQGVVCSSRHRQRVIGITLRGMNLQGSIAPQIGNLSFLKSIELGGNRFTGELPQEVGRLLQLKVLNFTRNVLTGNIPVNLSSCLELKAIDLSRNELDGEIPVELGSLKKLLKLAIGVNNLRGEFPSFLSNLSSIERLSLLFNHFHGRLPEGMGLLTNLSFLDVAGNKLTGNIPASLFNSSSIAVLSMAENFFNGKLPTDIGLKLPNLWALGIYGNQFTGVIPQSITNASRLQVLDLGRNKFEGQVPMNLGDLTYLNWFNIAYNRLGSSSWGDLNFIISMSNCSNLQIVSLTANNFGGELPNNIANLSLQLSNFDMGGNEIYGKLPEGFGRFRNLTVLGMGQNYFSGTIPSDFGEFPLLQALELFGNQFSGKIPSNLCNITPLYSLDLSYNAFEGEVNDCFGNSQNLRRLDISQNNLSGFIPSYLFSNHFSPLFLDLSNNSFTGSIPVEVGRLVDITTLNLSYNKFFGEIPETLGGCMHLEFLLMQGNYFQGSIPQELASLKEIGHLDLSQNNLTGQIPKDLGSLRLLKYLNLTFNSLEGEIPVHGAFENASTVSLVGNSKLCGGIPELQFPSCVSHNKKKRTKPLVIIITSAIFGAILIFTALSFCFFIYFKRQKRSEAPDKSFELRGIQRISYHELHAATMGFSQESLIGSGSFGSVYKGRLDQYGNRFVAVKVLNLQKNGASKSFRAECRALRNIRHRNIVPILTYCSSIDFKGHEFKAVVYKYMEKGSLDGWLHKETDDQSKNLNLSQRLKISMDVASALHYLHSHSGSMTIHCDLKPSNILLDKDLNAHVADFGLARLLLKSHTDSYEQETGSCSISVKGSIGYAAPEYGIGSEASAEGDVYSFGILLLEMFSGRRPTDDVFMDGLNLHNFIETNLQEDAKKITDPLLLLSGEGIGDVEKCIPSLFKIGLKCSESSPKDRMDMSEVLRELQDITNF